MPIPTMREASSISSLRVSIVGCGFAGLACAIESRLKGHSVLLLEKKESLDAFGEWQSTLSQALAFILSIELGDVSYK